MERTPPQAVLKLVAVLKQPCFISRFLKMKFISPSTLPAFMFVTLLYYSNVSRM